MDLNQWLDQQRRKSKQVNDKVDAALDFMRHQYGSNDRKILNEIRCIDFSKDVKGVSIAKRTILVGYKDPRVSPYKSSYFTRSGNPADRLGVSTVGRPAHYDHAKKKVTWEAGKTLDKVIRRYEVLIPLTPKDALMSTCAPAADTWSVQGKKVLAAGGGLQYLIPQANRFLKFLES